MNTKAAVDLPLCDAGAHGVVTTLRGSRKTVDHGLCDSPVIKSIHRSDTTHDAPASEYPHRTALRHQIHWESAVLLSIDCLAQRWQTPEARIVCGVDGVWDHLLQGHVGAVHW